MDDNLEHPTESRKMIPASRRGQEKEEGGTPGGAQPDKQDPTEAPVGAPAAPPSPPQPTRP